MKAGKRLSAMVCACALVLFGAACGDDGDDANTSAGRVDGASPSLSGQTIEVMGKWSGDEQASFEAVLDEFEKRTGATVTYTSGGDNLPTVLGTAVAGGNPPDVAILPQPGLMNDLARKGSLKPLSDDVRKLVDDNYPSIWRDLGTVDGTQYGLWFKAANKSTVWYRVDIFEDAGAKPPENWDDFVETAQRISDFGVTPISVGGADGWTLTDWFENVYLRTAGPEMYDKLSKHEIPWTDQSVIDAMNVLAEIWGNPQLLSGGTTVALQNDFTQSVIRTFSRDDSAAIVYEGDFVAGVIADNTDFTPGEDADFFPFPSIEGSDPAVMGGGDVAVKLDETPGAEALMKFLASADSAEIWAARGGFTSPNKNVDPKTYKDDLTRKSAEQLVEADTFRFDMSDLQPAAFGATEGSGMWGLFQQLLQQPSRSVDIARQLEAEAARAFG
jgi:ABC-type glycerol-3-phosphate transport system substrate-binding protein